MAAAPIWVLIFSKVSFGQCCLEKQMKDNYLGNKAVQLIQEPCMMPGLMDG